MVNHQQITVCGIENIIQRRKFASEGVRLRSYCGSGGSSEIAQWGKDVKLEGTLAQTLNFNQFIF